MPVPCVLKGLRVDETVKSLHKLGFQQETIALLERIAANLPGMIFQCLQQQDGSLVVLYVSSGCRELYELEPEVIQADPKILHKLIHPQDMAAFAESIAVAAATLTPWRWEGRIITPSGIKWIQGASQLERQVNGGILWDGLVVDITDRKKTEVSLQNLALKYSKAFSCSPDPITISTLAEGRLIEFNDSFVQLSGYERDEAIGRTALELNIWINESDRIKLLQELQTNKVVCNLEFEYRRKCGKLITALLSAEIIDLDGIPCLLAVHHDITERKQVEAQLRLSAQRDRLLAETLVRIRSSLNLKKILQTTVTEVRQFLQVDRVFIGLKDPQVGAKTVVESVDPNYPSVLNWQSDDESCLQELKTQLTTNRVRVFEDISQIAVSPKLLAHHEQLQTKAALVVPIMVGDELFGAVIANQCSGPRHWQPIEIDLLQQMSEQLAIAIKQVQLYQELAQLNSNLERQVEERTTQLQQKMQELEETQRVKDVVLHTVAHDLRTSVMGNLMVLKNLLKSQGLGTEDTGKRRHDETALREGLPPQATANPKGDTGNVSVQLSASPSSPQSLIPVSCSIIERMIQGNDRQLGMIDSLLEIHSCKEQGIVLHRELVTFSTLLQTIIKDLQPMLSQNQANLTNLVAENLPLVMADKTRLQKVLVNLFTYSLQNNPPGLNFTLKATVESGMIRTHIQDNGVAVSKLECDRLFDLYVRHPQAPCSTDIGLKMYLCRQIIQAHGGEIGVTSNRKCGLTFWFTLPYVGELV
ncbi:GAF domain-containing protein [Dendronalium sp. ChiSLP03b]|uniref:sensor histidine kinase n=1 Tax=Dendronalium sp. ChiSLP03b TaxID=3075381 RepID=UPI002AD504D9|nr:GAF domain-containing protein [Dendronalium sp. ChiSLP03b]MDZ8204987.1 PAS domain S-box protein [Dendronalium sp. ChiSLP03b]